MRKQNRWMIGALIALAASSAVAADGHVSFSGAVVEPTCSVDTAAISTASQAMALRSCGQSVSSSGVHYQRSVETLDSVMASSDRLLGYFASYAPLNANGEAGAKLVVRTYE